LTKIVDDHRVDLMTVIRDIGLRWSDEKRHL
jgi:hypothetical protein